MGTTGYLPPLVDAHASHVEYLAVNGYFGGDFPEAKKLKESDPAFKQAAMDYQEFAGIRPDGVFGAVSESRTKDKRCGLPDLNRGFVKAKNGGWKEWKSPSVEHACTSKWSDAAKGNLTCTHNSMSFSTLSRQDADEAWWAAFLSWQKVCGVRFKRVPWDGARSANFWATATNIDGSSGTLAWHYLPGCSAGSNHTLEGRYDTGERWSKSFFQAVCAHEDGHGLGLEHSSNRSDLLYPYANSNVITPQAGDIERVIARYGKPIDPTPDPPTDPPQPPTLAEQVEENRMRLVVHEALIRELMRR